ncbi:peptidoglycan D,D-transpeptidase FtsI family protein [Cohnella nanjingensis]|uniref:Penicillin-binding protein 2 n=1 Tax=Cohnella nanjingensis TaxID=1387779 RepID=A0A7X0RXG7_9BACL|nr:penicillin-binding protein 2 [Cohnella nanjingensis]MBB6673909.1 penicillin-binding protein 2 [Cohnella nanjingensis]
MNRLIPLRLFKVMLLLAAAFGIMEARLAWVQLGGMGRVERADAGLDRQAFLQRSDELTLDSGRGQFYDRNGRPMTGETVRALAAFPTGGMPRGTAGQVARLAELLGADADTLTGWLNGIRTPDVWRENGSKRVLALTTSQAEAIAGMDLTGVTAIPYRDRYPSGAGWSPLQAIGYVSQYPDRLKRLYGEQLAKRRMKETDLTGGAGLELSLDRLIQGVGETKAIEMTDAARRPLAGLGLRVYTPTNPHYPLQVKTTIDLSIQQAVEGVLRKHGIKEGAAVVLDARNADVLAMVSLPAFDPTRIGAPRTDETNHALIAVPPGSVFKTVTLAAALEAGVTTLQERFRCDGDYGRYGLHCWREGGHGISTVEQAFAESCNVVFAALAERLDPRQLQETADKMGLGRQIGWHASAFVDGKPLRLLEEEQAGSIFASVEAGRDGGVRTGTGIGQRDVRITPLQAANLAVTLLNGGRVLSPRLASEIRYADGGLFAALPAQTAPSAYGSIRPQTAAAILQGMRAVVTEGTAEHALKDAKWALAGKSGTAELGDGKPARNDHWFVGYGPADGKARYAVSILLENQPAGVRNRASAVFGEVMEALRQLDPKAAPRSAKRESAPVR